MKIRYVVKPNDSLWHIAGKILGDPNRWSEIHLENSKVISNPNQIHAGDVLIVDISSEEHWYSIWANNK
jgi:nucleoid-associated protein YgaU